MAKPCPSCGKMCSLELVEPEVVSGPDFEDGKVTAEVHLIRSSVCCGDGMKETDVTLEHSPSDEQKIILDGHQGEGHDIFVENGLCEGIDSGSGEATKLADIEKTVRVKGKKKPSFGASMDFNVQCGCPGGGLLYEDSVSVLAAADSWEDSN